MSNRSEVYKALKKQFISKAKGNAKERVNDLLNLYRDGKVFSKATTQREINRYLGRFKSEEARDLYYFQTMSKHLAKSLNIKLEAKRTGKIADKLGKLDELSVERLVKDETLTKSKKGAFSTLHIELNTQPAFENMPNEQEVEITKEPPNAFYYRDR